MIVSLLPKFNGIKIRITNLTHFCMDRNSVSEFPPVIPGKYENQKGKNILPSIKSSRRVQA